MSALKQDGIHTIAITSYNYGHYIGEAIESVVNQTSPNWKLVIYDNGSTDSTFEVLEPYLADPRITLIIHEQNIGARNNSIFAIRHADTQFFSFLQADDFLDLTFVENALLQFQRHPESPFVFFNWYQYLDDTKTNHAHNRFPFSIQRSGPLRISPFLTIFNFVPLHMAVFRTECLQYAYEQLLASPLKQVGEQFILKLIEDEYGLGCYSGTMGGAWRRHDAQMTVTHVQNKVAFIEEPIERQWYISQTPRPNPISAFMALTTSLLHLSQGSLLTVADWLLHTEGQRYAESYGIPIEQEYYRIKSVVLTVVLKMATFSVLTLYQDNELRSWIESLGYGFNRKDLKTLLLEIMEREGDSLINKDEIEQICHHCFRQKDQLANTVKDNALIDDLLNNCLVTHEQTGMSIVQIALSLLENKKDSFPTKVDNEQFLFKTCQFIFNSIADKEKKSLTLDNKIQLETVKHLLKSERFELMRNEAFSLRRLIFDWFRDYEYQRWIDNHALMEVDAEIHAERMMAWLEQPKFHFVLFLANEERYLLADTIDSLGRQFYKNWKLTVIADTEAPDSIFDEADMLQWITIPDGETDLYSILNNVCFTSDADWFAHIPAGTQFAPQMMLQFGDYINKYQHQMAYYCDDELIISGTKERFSPKFKPDFNLDMLRSTDYIGTVLCHRDVFTALGGFDALPGHEGMGLAFKIIERLGLNSIGHISDVLIHLPENVLEQRHRAVMKQAVEQHLQRLGLNAVVSDSLSENAVRVQYQWQDSPLVSIIIPTKDKLEFLRPCVESVLSKTDYPNYELIVVDNRSEDPDALAFLNSLNEDYGDRVRVLKYPHPFNYAAIGNMAAKEARGDYVLFLNNDTEVLHSEWLSRMMSHAQRKEVGVVGARLVYPETGLLQHAGVVLGLRGWPANHVYLEELHIDEAGYMDRAHLDQNFSAVTGACQLIRKSLYEQVQGMDEDNFAVLYNDIDLCLKIKEQGYLVVWTPYANLVHHSNVSQMSELFQGGRAAQESERAHKEGRLMMQKWRHVISHDPAYNRNLSLEWIDMRIESAMPVNWDVNFHDRTRILGLPLGGGSGDYRVIQPFSALSDAAIAQCESYRCSGDGSRVTNVYEYARFEPDIILFHATVNEVQLHQIEEVALKLPDVFRIFTIDDLLTDVPEQSSVYKLFRRHFADSKVRLRRALKACNRLIVSTQPLAELCADMCDDIYIVPNRLSREPWMQLTSLRNQSTKPRVGWAGAQQHKGDLAIIIDVVKETADEIDWIFMGMCPEELESYVKESHDFVPIADYPEKLASLNLDLAVAPLEQHPFNESKSNLRLLEYGILGWPVICTDIYPYRTDAPPVVHVDNDKDAWVRAIREFLSQPDLLHQAGDALREWVLDGYILEDHLQEWADALNVQRQQALK